MITVFTQIEQMIQSSAKNSILGIYGWIQLANLVQAATNYFGLAQYQE